jgi:magnesium-transporting ATPase (P-type)
MMLFRGFQDPDAPAWLVWCTMFASLAILHSALIWTALSFITVIQYPPGSLRDACSGTILWPLLLILGIFTAIAGLLSVRIAMNAQSGRQLPGHSCPHSHKRRAVIGGAATWIVLWMLSGISSQTSCAKEKLSSNSVRRMVLAWFYCHVVVMVIVGCCVIGERAHLWWRRRHVRLAREAYCASQVGVEGTGAGQKVLI